MSKSKTPKPGSQQQVVKRFVGVTLLPVQTGVKIAAWHWWLNDVLSMTEGERICYYGHSRIGKKLTQREYGTLFYVRIPNHAKNLKPLNDRTHRREAAAGDVEMQTRADSAASRSVQRPG